MIGTISVLILTPSCQIFHRPLSPHLKITFQILCYMGEEEYRGGKEDAETTVLHTSLHMGSRVFVQLEETNGKIWILVLSLTPH